MFLPFVNPYTASMWRDFNNNNNNNNVWKVWAQETHLTTSWHMHWPELFIFILQNIWLGLTKSTKCTLRQILLFYSKIGRMQLISISKRPKISLRPIHNSGQFTFPINVHSCSRCYKTFFWRKSGKSRFLPLAIMSSTGHLKNKQFLSIVLLENNIIFTFSCRLRHQNKHFSIS